MNTLLQKDSSIRSFNEQIEKRLLEHHLLAGRNITVQSSTQATVILPVVVHIIHNNGPENISDVRVLAAIQHLNEAFANTGYYDPTDGVNTNIQFCLAQRTPSGNATNGITRDVSTLTNMPGGVDLSDTDVKNINRWDPHCYINIWVVNDIPGPPAGYAYIPAATLSPDIDGIVVEAYYFGSSYSHDVVIIHEMGHYLGLYHTFEGGCANDDCLTSGDRVCDTPPDNSTNDASCTVSQNSCSTDVSSGFSTDQNDLKEDYMDYGLLLCKSVFTQGQADRMNWMINNVRSSLLNCMSCQPPCPSPVSATFASSTQSAPAGTLVSFTNGSANAVSYQWYVNEIPVATSFNYSQPFTEQGTYIVKLKAETGLPAQCISREFSDTIVITCSLAAAFSPAYNGVISQGQSVTFTNNSTGATSYEWYFDNVLVATSTNYTATFNNIGTHFIKLKSISQYCADSIQVYYIVNSDVSGNDNLSFIVSTNTFGIINNSSILTPSQDIVVFGGMTGNKNLVSKFTNTGDIIWSKKFDISMQSMVRAGINTIDGNYLFTIDNQGNDFSVIKVDASGNIIWQTKPYYNGSSIESHFSTDVIQLADGSYIIASTLHPGIYTSKILLFRLSNTGVVQWTKSLEGPYNSQAAKLCQVGNDVYLAGSIAVPVISPTPVAWDGLLLKLDPATGNLLFAKEYDAAAQKNLFVNMAVVNNKLLINGYINNAANQPSNIKTLDMIDLDGSILLSKEIQHENSKGSSKVMLVNNDSDIFIACNDPASNELYVSKLNASLDLVNSKKYNEPISYKDIANIHQLSGGNIILTANTQGSTIVMRTLPDLSTPGCIDENYVPVLQASSLSVNEITDVTLTSATYIEINPALIATDFPMLTVKLCKYTPVASTCDSAMVQNYYYGLNAPQMRSACQRANGNMLAIGFSELSTDVIIETDFQGNIISHKTFPAIHSLYEVKNTHDNGYVILGKPLNWGGAEFCLLKYDAAGNLQWSKQYDLDITSNLVGSHVYQMSDDGFFVLVGSSIVRLDAAGNFMFGKDYFPSGSYILDLLEDGPDVVYCMQNKLALTKMNKTTGAQLWSKRIPGTNILKSGNYYIVTTYSSPETTCNLLKIDNMGNIVTSKEISVPGATFVGHKMISTGTGGSSFGFVCNKVDFDPFLGNDIYVSVVDSSLNPVSAAKTNGERVYNQQDMFYDGDDELVIAGHTRSAAAGFLFRVRKDDPGNSCIFVPNAPAVISPGFNFIGDDNFMNSSALAVTVSDINVTDSVYHIFTERHCVSNNCVTDLACDTAGCSIYSISGTSKVCHLSDTVRIQFIKSAGCSLIPSWSVTGSATYEVLSQTNSEIVLLYTSAGNSTVSIKTYTSCKIFEDSLALNVFDAPGTLNLGPDINSCPGSVTTFHAGGGFVAYEWQDHSADSTFTAYLPGTYYVTATDFCSNLYKDTIVVFNIVPPSFELGPDTTLCSNHSLTLTAPAGFINYTWAPNYNINTTTGQTVQLSPLTDTVYTVTAILPNSNCLVMDSIRVDVVMAASVNIGPDSSFCRGDSIYINATAGFSNYLWNTNASTPGIFVSGVGSYSVIATDANGCIAKDTMRVISLYDLPSVNLGDDIDLCQGQNHIFNAGPGFINYLWQDNSTGESLNANTTGLYWVEVENSNHCVKRDSANIISVIPNPVITIGSDTSFCTGNSIQLDPGPGYHSYLWQDNSTGQTYTANAAGLYWVEVKDENNCPGRDSMHVINIYPKPLLNIGGDTSLCKGAMLTINAGAGFSSYLWQDNSTGQSFATSLAGMYWIKVSNVHDCYNADTINIVKLIDTPVAFIPKSIGICDNKKEFIKAPAGYTSLLWSNGNTNDSVLITQPGTYWLEVINAAGCRGKEDFEIFFKDCIQGIYFPNAFTPNNDIVNETYKPGVYETLEMYKLEIYNRYGQKLFESNDPVKGWDGTFKNVKQGIAAYIWVCTYKIKTKKVETKKGTFILLR